jgi:hypothetical protein
MNSSRYDGVPPFFYREVYRQCLSCFMEMEAVDFDNRFNEVEAFWLINKRCKSYPSAESWLMAMKTKSVGMMLFLSKFEIYCSSLDKLVQMATDHNQIELLLFLTHPDFKIVDRYRTAMAVNCPYLDKACMANHLEAVQFILHRFPGQEARMLRRPHLTLCQLMDMNQLRMLQEIVPHVLRISMWEGLKLAAAKGYKDILRYCLPHMDPSYVETLPDGRAVIPSDLLIEAAKHGQLGTFMLLKRSDPKGFIPMQAFQEAFWAGRTKICRYIQKRFPEYQPNVVDAVLACQHGHDDVLKLLPPELPLPDECFLSACRSPNYKLIQRVSATRPDFHFTAKMLTEAVNTGSDDVVAAVFTCGGYTKLPKALPMGLTTRGMHRALKYFYKLGFDVYTGKILLEAARLCKFQIIRDIFEVSSLKPKVQVLREAMNRVYVSTENKAVRTEAYTYLEDRLETRLRVMEEKKRKAPGAGTGVAAELYDESSLRNKLVLTKRHKHVPHQTKE